MGGRPDMVQHRRRIVRGAQPFDLIPSGTGKRSGSVSLVARGDEQGRVQGSASAVESLGRTIGPIWGNASLQHFGESMPYISAAALLMLTLAMTVGFHVADSDQIDAELATGR